MELIRRDEINAAYILALLASLNAAAQKDGPGATRAADQRRRIFEILAAEPSLRNKRDLIERFIDQRMLLLGPEDDFPAAFAAFWSNERAQAYTSLCEREDLDPAGVEKLVRSIVFTGKRTLADAVVGEMRQKPGLLTRRGVIERVVASIEAIISTFDEDVGDLDA